MHVAVAEAAVVVDAGLEPELRTFLTDHPLAAPEAHDSVPDELRQQLEALGYGEG